MQPVNAREHASQELVVVRGLGRRLSEWRSPDTELRHITVIGLVLSAAAIALQLRAGAKVSQVLGGQDTSQRDKSGGMIGGPTVSARVSRDAVHHCTDRGS